jgi:hypothetical protein
MFIKGLDRHRLGRRKTGFVPALLISTSMPSYTAIVYDTRWGTATSATGWITFGLPGGCRRIWVDDQKADDSGNGLTAATAKKTFTAAWNVFKSAWTAGDQIMIAGGTAGGAYTGIPGETATVYGGTSPSVMTVFQSYDRADPTGATTKYGELVGATMPVISLDNTNTGPFGVVNIAGVGYVACKGIEIKDNSVPRLTALSMYISFNQNDHPGMVYQNCRFNGIGLAKDPASATNTALTNTQNGGLISKSSQWNSGGVFLDSNDSFRIQEFISVHCAWNIESTRDDPVIFGGPTVFAHAFYLHASNTNLWLNRIVCADTTDGLGARCGSVNVNQLVSIDNPVGINSSGRSSDVVAERPDGAPWQLDDAVIMGSDKWLAPTGNPGGWAFEWLNNVLGSYSRNVAAFDFDQFGYDAGYNRLFAGARIDAAQVHQYMLCDKWSTWRYAVSAETDSGIDLSNYHFSVTNSVLDVMPTGLNGTVSGVSVRVTPPAGYKTRAQTYTAMGYASKSAMINAMLWRPDLPWAQAICGISLPAMGLTPLYQPASPPVVVGAPEVYKLAAADLTASTLNFTRGTPSMTLLSGIVPCSVLSCADFPAGFSNTAFRFQTTGTVTSGSNTITGVGSIAGVLPGMLMEAKLNAYTSTSLFPANTVVISASGTSIVCSANATGNSSGEAILISAGGRMISYDGTGSGAATPTIHILETPKDDGMATHTTALTLNIASGVAAPAWDTVNTVGTWAFTNSDSTAELTSAGGFWDEVSTPAQITGDFDFRVTLDTVGGGAFPAVIGVSKTRAMVNGFPGGDNSGSDVGYRCGTGQVYFTNGIFATVATSGAGDTIRWTRVGEIFTLYLNGSSVWSDDLSNPAYGASIAGGDAVYGCVVQGSGATGTKVTLTKWS